MVEAGENGPRLNLATDYRERYGMWEREWQKLHKVCMERGRDIDANLTHIGSYLIFGARTIDDFPTKLLRLLERHNFRINDDSHEFVRDLVQMLMLNRRSA